MPRHILAAAALSLCAALPASAEQYVVRLDTAYSGASPGLLAALKVTEIQSFTESGADYVVLDAPNKAYLQAFFYALPQHPVALNAVEGDWTAPDTAGMAITDRMALLRPEPCDFCQG